MDIPPRLLASKKLNLALPNIYQLPKAPQLRVEFHNPSSIHIETMTSSCADLLYSVADNVNS